MTSRKNGGLEIESSDAKPPEDLEGEEAKKRADEEVTKRVLDVRAKEALEKKQEGDRADAFAAPYWSAETALNWIAFREVSLIDCDLLDEISLYGNTGWGRFRERQPGDALRRALRAAAIRATGPDGIPIHASKWVHFSDIRLNDHRTWDKITFDREQVLRAFPANKVTDAVKPIESGISVINFASADDASGEHHFITSISPIRPETNSAVPISANTRSPISDADLDKKVLPYLKAIRRIYIRKGRKYDGEIARELAELKTRRKITRERFKKTYGQAGGGAPKGPKQKRKRNSAEFVPE